ncbi:hypothetical protein Fot_02635 [Forsythia ovata]|uniref:Uncharacterized protein n=1 Tax=Forsythia ovata TaxID=205694 RepID=A0ABD1X7E1_9LAMI
MEREQRECRFCAGDGSGGTELGLKRDVVKILSLCIGFQVVLGIRCSYNTMQQLTDVSLYNQNEFKEKKRQTHTNYGTHMYNNGLILRLVDKERYSSYEFIFRDVK